MIRTPQEVEVWYILPAIRRELTKALVAEGMTQKKVADLLGVGKPAITQYIQQKRGKEISFNKELKAEIAAAAKRILQEKSSVRAEIQNLCEEIEKSGLLCEIHKRQEKIPKECMICRRMKL